MDLDQPGKIGWIWNLDPPGKMGRIRRPGTIFLFTLEMEESSKLLSSQAHQNCTDLKPEKYKCIFYIFFFFDKDNKYLFKVINLCCVVGNFLPLNT